MTSRTTASFRRSALLVLATALSTGCSATHLAKSQWVEVSTENFRVVSNLPPESAQDVSRKLEQVHGAIATLADVQVPAPEPLTLYAFAKTEDFALLVDRSILGFFSWLPLERPFAALNAMSGEGDQVIIHEYVHAVLQRSGVPYPRWYNEGLAEFLENAKYYRDVVELGHISTRPGVLQLAGIRRKEAPVGTRLVRKRATLSEVDLFYARSWATVYYLVLGHLAEQGAPDRRPQLAKSWRSTPRESATTRISRASG